MTQVVIALDRLVADTVQADPFVRLKYKNWDLNSKEGNYAALKLERGGQEVVVDRWTPQLHLLKGMPIDFGTLSEGRSERNVRNHLTKQVETHTNTLLLPLKFRLEVQEKRALIVWFSLTLLEGEAPQGLFVPERMETSVLSLLQEDTPDSCSLERRRYFRTMYPGVHGQPKRKTAA